MVATTAAMGVSTLAGVGIGAADPDFAGSPGDVVSAEPVAYPGTLGVPQTDAWKIHYRSTDALGQPSIVSGTVIVPRDGHTGTRPLVTYAVGTQGLGDQCAPSASIAKGEAPEGVSLLLARGWAVTVTDYPGLGTPGDHTYLVGRSEGTAVLDAARAAQRIPEAHSSGVTQNSPVGIIGYSQGGHASGWAAELAHEYAPDLQVKGSVSGGVPADTLRSALDQQGQPDSGVGAYFAVAVGHNAAYPELDLDSYLTDEGKHVAEQVSNACVGEIVRAGEGKSRDTLLVSNPIDSPAWRERLAEDRLGTKAPGFPVYLFHGTGDNVVPYPYGEQLRSDWCGAGSSVEWRSYPLTDHVVTAILGVGPAVEWLGDRLAGKPTGGNCGR
ncbi:lipase family protein [Nocardia fluminea]|uniref:lipase family protein n=1 Tax=Nocardia fluminea TaxID=134984 RepID=UPI0034176F1D